MLVIVVVQARLVSTNNGGRYMKVDKHTKLGKIIKLKGMAKILTKHRVPCVTCPIMKMEMDTLEIGRICSMYGLNEKELLLDINSVLKHKDKVEKPKPKRKIKKI